MKLFIWAEPYRVQDGCSIVFAVAETLEEAKAQAAKGTAWEYADCPKEGVQGTPLGDPIRVVEVPCAEWHQWSE